MTYVKRVQYGDTTEIIVYDMPPRTGRPQTLGSPVKRRKTNGVRSRRSFLRSRTQFLQLVEHAVASSKENCFATFTFTRDVTPKLAFKLYGKAIREIRKRTGNDNLRALAVPELTERGRIHIHSLLFGICAEKGERRTRNIQRCFRHGFADVRSTDGNAKGIAWYMAKYFFLSLTGGYKGFSRAYHCSRELSRPTTKSFIVLPQYVEIMMPDAPYAQTKEYQTKYHGKVKKTVFTHSQ